MKTVTVILGALGLAATSANAQAYFVDQVVLGGSGGGVSGGSGYTLTGLFGLPEPVTMAGGGFTLTPSLWGVVSVIPNPDAPALSVRAEDRGIVLVWPQTGEDFALQMTTALLDDSHTVWTTVPGPYPTNQTQCLHLVPALDGMRYYRLHKP
jgi:hypothetical protein